MEKVDLEALDAMHAAAKSVGFVIEGDDLDTAQCGHYLAALHIDYPVMAAEIRALRERVASLYTGMRRVIVAAGGVAEDGVSDEFLLGAADEVSALREALEQIRGPLIVHDPDGLIEDATCTYCDASSVDGCDEDCPREIADAALSTPTTAEWLAARDAEQRRIGAAEELEKVRMGWLSDPEYGRGIPEIWRYIADRAARLRKGE